MRVDRRPNGRRAQAGDPARPGGDLPTPLHGHKLRGLGRAQLVPEQVTAGRRRGEGDLGVVRADDGSAVEDRSVPVVDGEVVAAAGVEVLEPDDDRRVRPDGELLGLDPPRAGGHPLSQVAVARDGDIPPVARSPPVQGLVDRQAAVGQDRRDPRQQPDDRARRVQDEEDQKRDIRDTRRRRSLRHPAPPCASSAQCNRLRHRPRRASWDRYGERDDRIIIPLH